MNIAFKKYQGAGNDFIMIDNRAMDFPTQNQNELIARMCDRNFGIGADGLILIQQHPEVPFEMVYFNSDGHTSSMCGNGGRCAVSFAKSLGLVTHTATFLFDSDVYSAQVVEKGRIALAMQDVNGVQIAETHCFLDTGSPHHVSFVEAVSTVDVQTSGSEIRYGAPYGETGTNVNFVETKAANCFAIRTYERGVEGETLACGTGAVAAAIAVHATQRTHETHLQIEAQGGVLEVSFKVEKGTYTDILLIGSAEYVFQGIYE